MRLTPLAGLLALMTGAAHAGGFAYDHVDAGYAEIDRADALYVRGSVGLDKHLYVLGGLTLIDKPNDNGFYLQGGLGYRLPLAPKADLYFNGQLLYADIGSADDIGVILRSGLRFSPVDKLELEGALAFSSNDLLIDDGIGLEVQARYLFTPQLAGSLGLHSDTEFDGVSLGIRYHFK